MNDELLYEVDANDRPLGARRRGDVHRLGLLHRSVHILVFNSRGELLLQKRSMAKDISPGLWDTSAAGHVDFGESYDDCARRELGEELGIANPVNLRCLFKLPASEHTGWEFVRVYRLVHDGPLVPNAAEIDTGRWFSADAVDAWIASGSAGLTTAFRVIWEAYRGGREVPGAES
jgi:isopentenyl-diphosphate delta-isomerase type 1